MTLVASAHVTRLHEAHEALDVSEQALRRSESHYRSLVEYAPFGVLRCTLEGIVLSANRALAEILRYDTAREIVGKHLLRDVYERDHDWEDLKASLAVEVMSPFTEIAWRRGDGSSSRVRTRFRVVRGEPGEGAALLGFVEDVTERQGLEDRLRQAQKMEAVGQLAGGVAHDFNNLLTVILGSCELLLQDAPTGFAHEEVTEIQGAAKKAAALTQQLLAFSRRQPLAPEVLDPNRVVPDVLKLLRRMIGEDVEIETILRHGSGMFEADPAQLQQVLMNLVVNARDAMPTGGVITIETARTVFDDEAVRSRPGARPGTYVTVAVSDTGTGMSAETQRRLFEPFFTTKEPGVGTGLGLATVYGVVRQSNGYIDVKSELGRGSTFTVCLPLVQAPAGETAIEALAPPDGGSETILLAEDEELLRDLARRVLSRAGYALLEAKNGEEAARVADEYGGVIHAVITDVVMPKKSGRALVEHLAATRGNLKVLYMSGYPDAAVERHGVFEAHESFLRKPFTPQDLLAALRTLLDEGAVIPL